MLLKTGKPYRKLTEHDKVFKTKEEAKEYCLSQFCSSCNPICKESCQNSYWRNCLHIRINICPYYLLDQVPLLKEGTKLSYCKHPNKALRLHGEFCSGRQCKELSAIVIEEEQKPVFKFGANIPQSKDYKMAASGDKEDV